MVDTIEPSPAVTPSASDASTWVPGPRTALLWTCLGLSLAVVGFALFGGLFATVHHATPLPPDEAPPVAAVVVLLLVFALLTLFHELLHGLIITACGARPRYRLELAAGIPAISTTARDGFRFSRTQFTAVALSPPLLVSALGVVLVIASSWLGMWLVVPLAAHLGGSVGDFTLAWLALRQPAGTHLEDYAGGVRFHRPMNSGTPLHHTDADRL